MVPVEDIISDTEAGISNLPQVVAQEIRQEAASPFKGHHAEM